jgi:hypothetical protein
VCWGKIDLRRVGECDLLPADPLLTVGAKQVCGAKDQFWDRHRGHETEPFYECGVIADPAVNFHRGIAWQNLHFSCPTCSNQKKREQAGNQESLG